MTLVLILGALTLLALLMFGAQAIGHLVYFAALSPAPSWQRLLALLGALSILLAGVRLVFWAA